MNDVPGINVWRYLIPVNEECIVVAESLLFSLENRFQNDFFDSLN